MTNPLINPPTLENSMTDLKQKLATAKTAYETARATLDNARAAYEAGPGKNYAEIKQNIDALKAQIEEYRRAHQAAKDALAQALSESNGAMTTKAKEALTARRNAEDMLEECRGLLAQVEETAIAVRLEASQAAIAFRSAYQAASKCWADMNVYAVLAECGERLCAAMAVRPVSNPRDFDAHSAYGAQQAAPRNVLLAEIDQLVKSYEGDTRPYVIELGVCDLGAMAEQEIMSPAEMTMERAKARAA
jgi:DNA repair exonuclease SbcCD ATPase subunit